jgi:hypothetical protein
MTTVTTTENRKRYTVRLSSAELEAIQEKADMAGITASEFIRRSCLGKRIVAKHNLKAINELKRLGGLQKHCIMQAPEHRAELNSVIRAILAAIKQLGAGGN